jgi:hypothetical protein
MSCKSVFILIPFLVISAGCKRQSLPNDTAQNPPDAAPIDAQTSKAFAPVVLTESDESKEQEAIKEKARKTLQAGDYDKLELMASGYRSAKDRYPDGRSKLTFFYDGLSELDETNSDEVWTAHIKALDRWVTVHPDSITAPVALADAWISYAWKARGHDYADSVDSQSLQLFQQRTASAHAVLNDAGEARVKCPVYWQVMQDVALDEGWSKSDYEKLFAAAVQNYPDFFEYYAEKSNYLLPRWYGAPGDWEAYVESAADKVGGEEGDVLYARLVWSMIQQRAYNRIFEETRISWARSRRGLELLHKRYPASLKVASEYCLQAGAMREKDTMKVMFEELAGRVDLSIWFDEGRFEAFRDWAFDK